MTKQWVNILAAAAIIGLTGCGSDSSTSSTSSAAGVAPTGTTVSGNTFTIDGVWKSGCFSSNGAGSPNEIDTITFSGSTGNVVVTEYASADTLCTGTATVAGNFDVTVVSGAIEAITGWENANTGALGVAAPAAKDGSGPLPTTASFTKGTATVTAVTAITAGLAATVAVGDVFDVSMVIDDTGLPVVGYTVNYAVGASTAFVDDFLTKQ